MVDTNKPILDISDEVIRQNWNQYKEHYEKSPYYEEIFRKWKIKHNISDDDIYFKILKKFIDNENINESVIYNKIHIIQENNDTLILKGLDGSERRELHKLCDKIGLFHESKVYKKNKKHMYIYKPENWLWEYTAKNPYSESDEVYKKREEEYNERQQRKAEKLRNIECDYCDKNAFDDELYVSPYITNIIACEDCLNYESDGNGGKLGDHKFEPLPY
jgi:hypothetical protein